LQGLKYLKQLTTLNFEFWFPQSNYSSETFLFDLFHHLSSLQSLTSLNLRYFNFNISEFLNLFIHRKNLIPFQQFHLYCFGQDINNIFLQQLAFALQHLQNLKKFHLSLLLSAISDTGITPLSEKLQKFPQTKNLTLDFGKCKNLNEKSLEILSKGIANLNLVSFNLNILGKQQQPKSFLDQLVGSWKDQKDQKEFASFSFVIQKFTCLSTLSLNPSLFHVNIKEFKRFPGALSSLINLNSLFLELPQFTSGNNFEGFTSFGLALRDLPNLNLLHLVALKGATLRDQEVMFLYLNVKACRFLKDLKLCFEQTNLIDEC